MLIDINKIKVIDRIRKDFGNIPELADDIQENGLINPPVITPEGVLIAGERRLRACEHLGYKQIEVRVMTVKDALHQLKLEISENENRKDFSFSEKMQWADQLKKEYENIAKDNMSKGGQGCLILDNHFRTDKAVANDLDMGKDTYRKAQYIYENGSEELIKKLDDGQLSINKAYITLKQEKEKLELHNKQLKEQLHNALNKEPTIIDNTDYSTINNLKNELNNTKKKLDYIENNKKILEQRVELLQQKADLYEKESEEYKKFKEEINQITKKRDDLERQFQAVTSISGLVVEIDSLIKTKLAPVKYSKAILEVKDDDVVVDNLSQILEIVYSWYLEMKNLLPNNSNYINVEVL